MKILLISFSYRPSLNPRAFRWTAIAEQWVREGHEVDVVCEAAAGRPATETCNGVRLNRAGAVKPAQARGRGAAPSVNPIRTFAQWIWRRIYWPDYAFRWYRPALQRAQALLNEGDYDLLVSSSIPFTGHLVALTLMAGRSTPRWVVDIGDPFSFADGAPVNNFALYSALNRLVERRVLDRADAVSVTTEGTRQRYCCLFPSTASKITVIPPMLPPAFDDSAPPSLADDRIRLVFVGTTYRDIRSPVPLLRGFRELLGTALADKLELHFYGSSVDCEDAFAPYADLLGNKIFRHGLVPQDVAGNAMRSATALINIGNDTEYQLPSKVIEYLAFAKPVVNFVSTDRDSSAAFFRAFDSVLTVRTEDVGKPEVTRAIAELIGAPPAIDAVKRCRELDRYRVRQVAADYSALGAG